MLYFIPKLFIMNYLNPIPMVEKWTRKNRANNLIISFCCLFLLLLTSSLNAQSLLCPQDFQVDAALGQCEAVVNYDIDFINPACLPMSLTQSTDNSTVTMSIGCTDMLGSQHLRVFDLPAMGVSTPLALESCLLYTSPSPRDQRGSRMPSSA